MGTLSSGDPNPRLQLARYGVLALACSLSLITYLDRICIMRVKESIVGDLHFSTLRIGSVDFDANEQMGWVFAVFSVGYLLFEIPGGWLGDRWGARRVLIRIVLWWSAFTALTGLVFPVAGWPVIGLGLMLLVRFLFGAGEAGAYPNLTRVVRVWFPPRRRARAQGLIWMCARLGGAIAPSVIGRLTWLLGGWRPAFWVLGAIGVAWVALFYRFYRDRPPDEALALPPDAQLPPEKDNAYSHPDAPTPGTAGHEWPSWRVLASSLTIWAICLMTFSVGLGWYFLPTWQPEYFQQVYGIRYNDSEILTGLPFVCGAAGALLGGSLSDTLIRFWGRRWGRSVIGLIGFTLAGSCVVATGLTTAAWQAVLLLCLMSFFNDLALPLMWSVCADVGGRFVGSVAGLMNMANGTGAVLCMMAIPVALRYLTGGAPAGSSAGAVAAGQWLWIYAVLGSAWFVGAACWLVIDAGKPVFGEQAPATGA